jgi:polyhydroxybutyrate depolymerase
MRYLRPFIIMLALMLLICTAHAQADSLEYDGQTRTYTLHVPANIDSPMPLLIVLHRGAYSGEEMRQLTGFDAIADREGFIVVYPDGIDGSWNDGLGLDFLTTVQQNTDDVGFIAQLIDTLSENYSIDSSRVYVTGFSSGGNLAYLLACQLADRIAAFAVTGSLMMQHVADSCTPSRPIPMLMIQGTEDPVFAWDGGQFVVEDVDYGYQFSASETLDYWWSTNGCTALSTANAEPDIDPEDNTRVWHEVYTFCSAPIELYAVIGGGHNWAGVPTDLSRDVGGTVSYDINASEIIWAFLSGQRLAD